MKSLVSLIVVALFFSSCGNDSPAGGNGSETPIVGGSDLVNGAISANLTNARPLDKAEARVLIENNFAAITRYEVGMKWRESAQRLLKGEDNGYCYSKSIVDYEILEVLPAGTAANVEGDALKVRTLTKYTALEGDLCSGEIGEEEEYTSEYEMENWAASETVDSMLENFDLLQSLQVGLYQGKTAIKATVSYEGINFNFVDFIDQPSIVGTHITHYQENFAGKTFQIVSKSDLIE